MKTLYWRFAPRIKRWIKNTRIETFFSELEYIIYRVEKDRERFVRLVQLNNIGANTDPAGWDYLAIPSELQATVSINFGFEKDNE